MFNLILRHDAFSFDLRSEEHTSELQSRENLVCRLLLEKNTRGSIELAPITLCAAILAIAGFPFSIGVPWGPSRPPRPGARSVPFFFLKKRRTADISPFPLRYALRL